MRRYLIVFLIFLPFINESYSQTSQAIELNVQYGKVFQINQYLDGTKTGKPVEIAKSLSARYIIHTDGSKDWHQTYNYMDYGLGLYFAAYNEPIHLGNSFAFYSFIYSPIARLGRFTLKNDLVIGLSFVQKHWSLDNFQNTAIGSTLNCFVQEGFLLDYKLSERVLIGFGLNFSHISNGATKQPNTGINTLSSQINLRYNFYDKEVKYNVERPDFEKSNVLLLSLFGAVYNDRVELDNYAFNDSRRYVERDFYAFGLTTTAYKNFSFKNNFGFGFTLGYDDYADNYFMCQKDEIISTTTPFLKRLNLNCFASYEYKINRFSAFADLGYYLIRKTNPQSSPNFFQRVGMRYRIVDNVFASVAIRATAFSIAHYIEWSLGYRFKTK
ncbi:MAG: hypothetical protein H6Q16_2062 [Bacteroidetes bacterium]|nr:hypothetical protein [Bacteroidota bacterium]